MRTTVEIKPEHRDALLALAARRGHKRISTVLAEVIDTFLLGEVERENRRKTLLLLSGSLSRADGEKLRRATMDIRRSW
jgi:ATP phosphoribosyltransferase regulatory subunit HisZ